MRSDKVRFPRWLRLPKLWCAGRLGRCPVKDGFHSGCLVCRWRRSYLGKWAAPPYWILYTLTCNYRKYVHRHNPRLRRETWWTVHIDPRGHFTGLRCAAIIVFDKLLKRFSQLEKPLVEFIMFLSCYPNF